MEKSSETTVVTPNCQDVSLCTVSSSSNIWAKWFTQSRTVCGIDVAHIYSHKAAERWSRTLNVLKDETRIVEGTKVWRHILFWRVIQKNVRISHPHAGQQSGHTCRTSSHFSTRTCCSSSSVVVLVRSSTYSKSELNPRVLHWVEVWPAASLADSQLSLLPH